MAGEDMKMNILSTPLKNMVVHEKQKNFKKMDNGV